MFFYVFTTMPNGELRCYNVSGKDVAGINTPSRIIEFAKKMDEYNYPENKSPFNNVSIVANGTLYYDLVYGEEL